MARPHAKTLQETKERAWRYISPAIGKTRYVWWRSGIVPAGSPAWADNGAPPPIKDVISGGIFCAGVATIIRRELGLEVPNLGNLDYDGGVVAYFGSTGQENMPKIGYFEKKGVAKPFNASGALKPWTLIGRRYRNAAASQDSRNGQGHVAIVLPNGRVLQAYDAGGGRPGLNATATLEESHAGWFYELMVEAKDWMLPKGATPDPGGDDAELFTVDQLAEISQNPDPVLHDLAGDRAALVPEMEKAGITTKRRVAAFLGNACQETDRLKTLEEYGDEAYFRSFLGNEWRYHGRGYLMNTWKAAYRRLSAVLGVDLVESPDLLSERKDLAAKAAVWFWTQNGLADYADAGNFRAVAAIINTGTPNGTPNGWPERKAFYDRAMRILPETSPVAPKKPRLKPNLVAVGQLDEEAMHAAALVFRRRGFDVTSTRGKEGVAAFDGIFGTEPLGTRQMVVIGGPAFRTLSPASRAWVYDPPNLDESDYIGCVGESYEDTLSLVENVSETYAGSGAGSEFRAVLGARVAPLRPVKPPVPVEPKPAPPEGKERPVLPTKPEPAEPVRPTEPNPETSKKRGFLYEPVFWSHVGNVLVAVLVAAGALANGGGISLQEAVLALLTYLVGAGGMTAAARSVVKPLAKESRV